MRREKSTRRGAALALLVLLGAAAPGAAQTWNQAYGNGNNNSFLAIKGTTSVAPAWRFPLPGPAAWAGPAVGADGRVWVGTTNGVLQAVNSNGTFSCTTTFEGASITSTPAILVNGRVAVLLHRPDPAKPDRFQTSLALVTPGCGLLWTQELPRLHREFPSFATGSVKLWFSGRPDGTFLFVHSAYSNPGFVVEDPDLNATNEILAYDEGGTLFARHPVSRNCIDVHGGGGFDSWGDLWDWATSWWPEAGTVDPLYRSTGWPMSTPAVVASKIPGIADPTEPLIAVTDHACEARLEIFQFHPSVTNFANRLTRTWTKEVSSRHTFLSSPAVGDDGRALFGSSDNRVRSFDLVARSFLWEKGMEEPVMHPPAVTPTFLFANTDHLTWILTPEGDLTETGRPQPWTTGSKVGAGAASQLEGIIGHYKELTYLSSDLYNTGHTLTHDHIRNTNPALTASGRVYAITQTDEKGAELVALGPNP